LLWDAGTRDNARTDNPFWNVAYGRVVETIDVPTYASAALGFRCWSLSGTTLRSVGVGLSAWHPGTNVGYCSEHTEPEQECQCGLYAYHSLGDALDLTVDGDLVGVVAARGALQVHAEGFRSEQAVIIALAIPHRSPSQAVQLQALAVAERYGVPLVALDQLAALGAQFAEPVPLDERPLPQPQPSRVRPRSKLGDEENKMFCFVYAVLLFCSDVIAFKHHPSWELSLAMGITTVLVIVSWMAVLLMNWSRHQRAMLICFSTIVVTVTLGISAWIPQHSRAVPEQLSVFTTRLMSDYQTSGHWPQLSAVDGYQAAAATRPHLSAFTAGRCLNLVWVNNSLDWQRICAKTHR
jgi:hypothetical protein